MMPNAMLELSSNAMRTKHSSPELRAYLRDEWGSDTGWLDRLAPRTSLLTRARAWFRRPARTRTPSPLAADSVLASGIVAVSEPVHFPDDCPHLAVEDLGFGGTAEFLRCSLCGGVLVVHAGRQWAFGSVAPVTCDEVPCE